MLYRDLTPRENLRFHARLHDVPLARVDEVLERRRDDGARGRPASPCCRAGWSSASRPRARCCTTPSCCSSTSRSRTSTPPPPRCSSRSSGARSGRTRVVTSHDPAGGLAGADLALGLRGGRPAICAPAARRRARRRRGALRLMVRAVGAILRKDLLLELRTRGVRPGDGDLRRHDARRLPLRARPPTARGRSRGRRAVGDVPVRGDAGASTGCSSPSRSRAGSTASCSRRSTARRCCVAKALGPACLPRDRRARRRARVRDPAPRPGPLAGAAGPRPRPAARRSGHLRRRRARRPRSRIRTRARDLIVPLLALPLLVPRGHRLGAGHGATAGPGRRGAAARALAGRYSRSMMLSSR